jgi:hypothetical protein
MHGERCDLGVHEVIVVASRTPPGRRSECQASESPGVLEVSGCTGRTIAGAECACDMVWYRCWMIIRGVAGMPERRAVC